MTYYRGLFSGAGLNVFVRAEVLIQIEMKNWRSRLEASNAIFRGFLGGHHTVLI
jgi:hypothetical protein